MEALPADMASKTPMVVVMECLREVMAEAAMARTLVMVALLTEKIPMVEAMEVKVSFKN